MDEIQESTPVTTEQAQQPETQPAQQPPIQEEEKGPYACEECGKEYTKKSALRMHMVAFHKLPASTKNADVSAARSRSDSATETLAQKVERLRKSRVPIGVPEKKWSCPVNDGYQYRVFNENWMTRPGNIQKAQAAGYEFVQSDSDKEKPQIVGTNDNGTPITGYLMRIPKEIYDEDQRAKQKEVDRVDKQIREGSLAQGAGEKRYIPSTGIKITSDNRPPG
jgi:hypothetical protein